MSAEVLLDVGKGAGCIAEVAGCIAEVAGCVAGVAGGVAGVAGGMSNRVEEGVSKQKGEGVGGLVHEKRGGGR